MIVSTKIASKQHPPPPPPAPPLPIESILGEKSNSHSQKPNTEKTNNISNSTSLQTQTEDLLTSIRNFKGFSEKKKIQRDAAKPNTQPKACRLNEELIKAFTSRQAYFSNFPKISKFMLCFTKI